MCLHIVSVLLVLLFIINILTRGCPYIKFDREVSIFTVNIGTSILYTSVYFHKRVHIFTVNKDTRVCIFI